MSTEFRKRCKKSAQDGTTVTLVSDDGGMGEGRPLQLDYTQVVATFTATPTEFYGTAAGDGRKFEVIIRRVG